MAPRSGAAPCSAIRAARPGRAHRARLWLPSLPNHQRRLRPGLALEAFRPLPARHGVTDSETVSVELVNTLSRLTLVLAFRPDQVNVLRRLGGGIDLADAVE